ASAGTLRDVAVDAAMGVFTAGALRGGSGIIKNALPSKPPTALLGEVRVLASTAALNPRAVVQPRQLPAGPPAPLQLPAPRPNTTFIDPHGNALRGPPGATITGSPDGRFVQVRDAKGVHTGTRIDQGHKPAGHPDPRAQRPHGHVDGVTN